MSAKATTATTATVSTEAAEAAEAPPQARAATPVPHAAGIEALARAYRVRALVLQGGGALGSYQGGVYQGLAEHGIEPDWVAGISIGALNAAVIAGNAPQRRVEQLRSFWEYICGQPWLPSLPHGWMGWDAVDWPDPLRLWYDGWHALRAVLEGQRGFFVPRSLPRLLSGHVPTGQASFYDTSALRATLERFADFDRINDHRTMRVSLGAVNVHTGNFAYFDNTRETLRPEHFMASGALPPGFPAVEVDGEYYWDGGLVSNTPLAEVLSAQPRRDALIFQVDLWSARGHLPHNLMEVAERQKDIQYSSRTRAVTDTLCEQQNLRRLLSEVLELVPPARREDPWYKRAVEHACTARRNVIHLIYRDKSFEGNAKDYQFGRLAMEEHWESGLADIRQTLQHPEWLAMPGAERPFVTHDVHRERGHGE